MAGVLFSRGLSLEVSLASAELLASGVVLIVSLAEELIWLGSVVVDAVFFGAEKGKALGVGVCVVLVGEM